MTDTWRTWELVLPALERHHDVLAPTLAGHAGGPPLEGAVDDGLLADAVERAMDEAGFERAHLVGNSLGGHLALKLASRDRAESVVALAPAGGWADGNDASAAPLELIAMLYEQAKLGAPHVGAIVATRESRRRATEYATTNFEHIPAELIAHQIVAVAACHAALPLIESARGEGWSLDAERIDCPIRVVWGAADRLLAWPSAAARYRDEWLANADWVELEGVGHCPQLDVPIETAELILGWTAKT
jgi:pimeloyl-ACP methyl ester carboxylesterase